MKKLSQLLLFLLFVSHVSGQRKSEFGLVVKAGFSTIPFKKTDPNFNYLSKKLVTSRDAGSSFVFGVWESLRLNGHFRFSMELLTRFTTFHTRSVYISRNLEAVFPSSNKSVQLQQENELNLSVPVRFHYSFRKNGRTTFAIGGGISHNLYTVRTADFRFTNQIDPREDFTRKLPESVSQFDKFNPVLSMTAGVYHKIDLNTTIGLEYVQERRWNERLYTDLVSDSSRCYCYVYTFLQTPGLRSFAVSLYHNLLR